MFPILLVDTLEIGQLLRLTPLNVQLFKNLSPNVRIILDFNELFQNSGIGRQLGQRFFGQKKWMQYLLESDRAADYKIYFEVERNYYNAATNGTKIIQQKMSTL